MSCIRKVRRLCNSGSSGWEFNISSIIIFIFNYIKTIVIYIRRFSSQGIFAIAIVYYSILVAKIYVYTSIY